MHNYTAIFHTYYALLHKNETVSGLFPDIKLLKKMFPTILYIKNANRAQNFFFQNMNVEDISYLWNIFGVVSPKFYPESQKPRVSICLSVHFILRDFKNWAIYR